MNGNKQSVGNIRELIGHLIGKRLTDITQQDNDHEGDRFIEFMFEDGNTATFFLADGEAYQCGFPMCFSDPDPNAPEDDGFYHPEPADTADRKWAAVAEYTNNGEVMHVIPCFGNLHYIGETCDCRPAKQFRDDGSWYFSHEEMNDGMETSAGDVPQT